MQQFKQQVRKVYDEGLEDFEDLSGSEQQTIALAFFLGQLDEDMAEYVVHRLFLGAGYLPGKFENTSDQNNADHLVCGFNKQVAEIKAELGIGEQDG
ncbi:hypothetical protein N9917_04080 [Deltaproteobacteria bacterium]|nr:hypothetical protein [Deltaproteobacteria bacterium]